ncbi:MAG TPA: glycosyltransferase, partial [Bacilli bacterium]
MKMLTRIKRLGRPKKGIGDRRHTSRRRGVSSRAAQVPWASRVFLHSSRSRAYRKAYNLGYDKAFNEGWDLGIQNFSTPLDLTSIIIPTYNQLGYLKLCIESIQAKTLEPYELIVIDSGSTDETANYLRSLPNTVKYQLSPEN